MGYLKIINWISEQWKNHPLDLIAVLATLAVLVFVIRDFFRDRPDVKVEFGQSTVRSGGSVTVSGITISVRNKGKRPVVIRKIGIMSPNEEKPFRGGLDWVLGEQQSRSDYTEISLTFIPSTTDLYKDIQSGKYVVFAEDDNGKRYWSCSPFKKFKIVGRF